MTTVVNFVCDRTPDQNGCRFVECENEHGESISAGEWRLRADGLVELHVELSQPPIIQTLHDNGEIIALQATVAQQAQMIEHLRGGPTPLYTAVDMANAARDGFTDGAAKLNAAYRAGWDASAEGWNAEHPCDAHEDVSWQKDRDAAIAIIIAADVGKEG